MKMKMILIGLILVMATIFGCKDTDDQVIQPSKLPAAAQSFIETNFPGAQFVLVTVDKDFAETTYDVVLNNGVKLEFDAKGEWKEVEARPSEVPANIIPNQIRTYVTEHYPETKIVKINRDPNDYEVDLSNGVELKFNSKTFAIIDIDTKSQAYVAETEANVNSLPGAAKAFIAQHFEGRTIVSVRVDRDDRRISYDVILSDGAKLEFDQAGEWKEVNTRTYAVPAAIIPVQIHDFVTARYPSVFIIKIDRDRTDYEIDLSNGVEIKFDLYFNVIKIENGHNNNNGNNDNNHPGAGQLPANAQAFIAQHFGHLSIVNVKVDRDDRRISYDVILSDGTKLEFDQAGEWKEVNTHTYAVPAAIIPVQIHSFVTARYPGAYIFQIDRDSRDYEIDLSNGVEIKFDLYFNVIKIENDRNGNNGNNDNNHPGAGQLPANAQAFIAQHFGHLSIVNVKVDRDDRRISYDVVLSDGTKLEFDQAGEWKEVNTRTYAVPAAIIPAPIRQQVSDRYPYAMIIKIDRDSRDYKVKLSNGVELKFDRYNYRLIKIENDNDRDDDQVVGYRDLPAAAKSFIAEHFANVKVVKVEKDRDDGKITYEVRLSDGAELEFRQNGDWKEVNTRTYPVPTAIVPTQITQQIANRFPGAKILKISRSHKKYEVKLSNGLEVSFNPRTFVITEIDD